MNDLMQIGFFVLMNENSQKITNQEIENAYGCFMEQLKTASQSEQNYSETFRMLDTTRIELAFLKSHYRYEQEKKCPEICLYPKGISIC